MLFLVTLIVTTLAIAGSAAFFSIYGLAHTFSGAFWSVVFMGASLEAGKLISASFLYRYWKKTGAALKTYLIAAVLLLMVITSVGIFAFLSAAYQTDTIQFKEVETKISSLTAEKEELSKRKIEIDKQISQLPENYVKARQRLMETFKPELNHINKRLPDITSELTQLKQQKIQVQAHTGPITYIADAFGVAVDDATKWIILMLIVVFDPLAVVLTIAINIILMERSQLITNVPQSQPITNIINQVSGAVTPRQVFKNEPDPIIETQEAEEPTPMIDTVEQLQETYGEPTIVEQSPAHDDARITEVIEAKTQKPNPEKVSSGPITPKHFTRLFSGPTTKK